MSERVVLRMETSLTKAPTLMSKPSIRRAWSGETNRSQAVKTHHRQDIGPLFDQIIEERTENHQVTAIPNAIESFNYSLHKMRLVF